MNLCNGFPSLGINVALLLTTAPAADLAMISSASSVPERGPLALNMQHSIGISATQVFNIPPRILGVIVYVCLVQTSMKKGKRSTIQLSTELTIHNRLWNSLDFVVYSVHFLQILTIPGIPCSLRFTELWTIHEIISSAYNFGYKVRYKFEHHSFLWNFDNRLYRVQFAYDCLASAAVVTLVSGFILVNELCSSNIIYNILITSCNCKTAALNGLFLILIIQDTQNINECSSRTAHQTQQ